MKRAARLHPDRGPGRDQPAGARAGADLRARCAAPAAPPSAPKSCAQREERLRAVQGFLRTQLNGRAADRLRVRRRDRRSHLPARSARASSNSSRPMPGYLARGGPYLQTLELVPRRRRPAPGVPAPVADRRRRRSRPSASRWCCSTASPRAASRCAAIDERGQARARGSAEWEVSAQLPPLVRAATAFPRRGAGAGRSSSSRPRLGVAYAATPPVPLRRGARRRAMTAADPRAARRRAAAGAVAARAADRADRGVRAQRAHRGAAGTHPGAQRVGALRRRGRHRSGGAAPAGRRPGDSAGCPTAARTSSPSRATSCRCGCSTSRRRSTSTSRRPTCWSG